MNPLQRIARMPRVYRWMLGAGPLVERTEHLLRWASRGRLGALDLAGLPTVRVTVRGRRTGTPRTITIQVIHNERSLLVVGSNWARQQHPAWSFNFLAAREVTVWRRGERFTATVRLLTGTERQRAWEHILTQWPNYRIAQEQVPGREFRLFELTPVAQAS